MITCNEPIFTNSNMSGSLTSTPFLLEQFIGYSIQLTWTGTPTGSFSLQLSDDVGSLLPNGTVTGVTNYTTVNNSTSSVSGAGTLSYNVNFVFYRWVQVVYTASTGGTASLIGRIQAKG